MKENIGLLLPLPTIIVLVETFLHKGISSSELGLYNYIVFRRDRYDFADSPCRGGVLITVHKNLHSSLVFSCRASNTEHLFVEVSTPGINIILGAAYLPPYSSSDVYEDHVTRVELLKNSYLDRNFITLGDYNLPNTVWTNGEGGLSSICSSSTLSVRVNSSTVTNSFPFINFT